MVDKLWRDFDWHNCSSKVNENSARRASLTKSKSQPSSNSIEFSMPSTIHPSIHAAYTRIADVNIRQAIAQTKIGAVLETLHSKHTSSQCDFSFMSPRCVPSTFRHLQHPPSLAWNAKRYTYSQHRCSSLFYVYTQHRCYTDRIKNIVVSLSFSSSSSRGPDSVCHPDGFCSVFSIARQTPNKCMGWNEHSHLCGDDEVGFHDFRLILVDREPWTPTDDHLNKTHIESDSEHISN